MPGSAVHSIDAMSFSVVVGAPKPRPFRAAAVTAATTRGWA
jgi:hypothetical protein